MCQDYEEAQTNEDVEETQVLSAALLKLNAGVLFMREGWQEIMRVKKKECK